MSRFKESVETHTSCFPHMQTLPGQEAQVHLAILTFFFFFFYFLYFCFSVSFDRTSAINFSTGHPLSSYF